MTKNVELQPVSYTHLGAFNLPYTRKFEDDERVIYIDLYRPVYSIDDWKARCV